MYLLTNITTIVITSLKDNFKKSIDYFLNI